MELAVHTQRNFAEVKHPNRDCSLQSCPLLGCQGIAHPAHTDMPLRRGTQALRLIANTPLIQRRKKSHSREEESAFTQWGFSIYAHSLKDQARKSKYPRTQILEPRTQPKLICHASTTFIPARSNNLIQVTSQSYIASRRKLYRNPSKAIQESAQSYIAFFAILYSSTHVPIYLQRILHKTTSSLLVPSPSKIGAFRLRRSKAKSASYEEMALRNGLKMYRFRARNIYVLWQDRIPVI